MRVPRVLGILAACLLGLACLAAAAGAQGGPRPAAAQAGELYVLQAQGGALERVRGGWRLVLRRPAATVTSFSDRPARLGGAVPLRRFVARWRAAFGGDPPNAALQLDRAPIGRDVVLLELLRPRYRPRARTLTFRVRPLRTTDRRGLATIARRADRRVAARFGRASLFIDDGPSAIGYEVTFNLLGGIPSNAPVEASLTLTNTTFLGDGTLRQPIVTGRTVTPAMTTDLSSTRVDLTLPSGAQALLDLGVALPAGGTTVTGQVVLPTDYMLIVSSEAGTVTVHQSGPISFPAPPPPP